MPIYEYSIVDKCCSYRNNHASAHSNVIVVPDTYQGRSMKRKLFSMCLLLSVAAGLLAYDFKVGDLCYNITNDTHAPYSVEVTYENGNAWEVDAYSNLPSSVLIPESVTYNKNNYNVTGIGGYAFCNCTKLTSLTIPNSVTSMGEYAFAYCTGLTSITIPNSVTWIGGYAFKRTPWLENQSGLIYIGSVLYAYRGEMPENTSIVIKDGVTSIGQYAFDTATRLSSITIPNSVTRIGEGAFAGCRGLTSVTIGNSVTSIGERAFYGCAGLTSITIPNSVTSIEEGTFYDCSGLTSVTIPNSVTKIGGYAFSGCTGLTSVTIGNSVTSIGESVFYDCTGLTSIIVESSNTVYDSRNNCNAIIETATNTLIQGCKTTIIPNSVTSIRGWAFEGCTGLISVTIGNSVTRIGESAFYNCTGLTSITIPNSVTSIGTNAFSGCTNLTSITIPNSVTSIEPYAFYGCTGLTSITISNSITSIESGILMYCTGLTSVTIGNSVTSIGEGAFFGCKGLTSITIPDSVMHIGYNAFSDCTGLTSITSLVTTPPTINTDAFSDVSVDIPVHIPCGTKEVYSTAKGWNLFTNYKEQLTAIVTITSQDENKGTITITKQATSCEDNEYTFVATPKADYCFVQWSDGNTDNPRTIMVTEDMTLTAKFEATSVEAIEEVADNQPATTQKIVHDGQVYILRDGKTYTIVGQRAIDK